MRHLSRFGVDPFTVALPDSRRGQAVEDRLPAGSGLHEVNPDRLHERAARGPRSEGMHLVITHPADRDEVAGEAREPRVVRVV